VSRTIAGTSSVSAPGERLVPRPALVVLVLLGLALLALVAAGCGAAAVSPSLTRVMVAAVTEAPLGVRDTAYSPTRPAPPLHLTDQDGRPFDLASIRGRPAFAYFGYTHCPDVCPASLAELRAAIKASGVDATVVFVTVDPARDDAAAMKQYVDRYGAGFVGLTGTQAQIAEAAGAWGISYRKLESGSATGYAMAHSAEAYLVDADGTLRHHLFFGAPAELIADRLREVAGE
jgi:protein SCO1/2